MSDVWDYTNEGAVEEKGVDCYFLGVKFEAPYAFSGVNPKILINFDNNTPPEAVLDVLNDLDCFNLKIDRVKVGTENGALKYADVQVTRKEGSFLFVLGGEERKTSIFSTAFQTSDGQTKYNHRIHDTGDVELIRELSDRLGWPDFAGEIAGQVWKETQRMQESNLMLMNMGRSDVPLNLFSY